MNRHCWTATVEEGGTAGIAVRSYEAVAAGAYALTSGGCSGGITLKPRSWVVFPSLRGVLIAVQAGLLVLLLGGAIGLVTGVKVLVDSRRFVAKAANASGVVVDVDEAVQQVRKRGSGDNWYYEDVTVFYPVIRFVTARGQAVEFRAGEGSSDPFAHGVGDPIRVLYDPANPQAARLDTWTSRWGDSITLVAVGLGLLVIGGVGSWLLRSPRRAARRAAQPNPPPQESEQRADGWPQGHLDSHRDQASGDGATGPAPAP
jgi:hypothetical protein